MVDDTVFAPGTIRPMGSWGGVVEYGGGDRNMVVMFYTKAIHNPAKSKEAGRQVFEDQVYVRIHPPGERLNIVDRPADESHAQRFPQQWHAFLQNHSQTPDGTPVDMLYPEQPSIGAMLKANGIHTVEQLAELSAHAIDTIGMGAQRYVNAAVTYLKAAKKGVDATEFRNAIEERDQKIKILGQQVEDLKGQIDQIIKGNIAGQMTAEKLNQIIAGAMQRPVHMGKGFDSATAQINATHPTKNLIETVRHEQSKPRRQRPKMRA